MASIIFLMLSSQQYRTKTGKHSFIGWEFVYKSNNQQNGHMIYMDFDMRMIR